MYVIVFIYLFIYLYLFDNCWHLLRVLSYTMSVDSTSDNIYWFY